MAADVEQLLVGYLRPLLETSQVAPAARVCTELDGIDFDAADFVPVVHVAESTTGSMVVPGLDVCEVDIDVYARAIGDFNARTVARDLSEEVREWVLAVVAVGAMDGGLTSVNHVSNPGKPARLPYDNSDLRRWSGMYRLWVHSRA